VSWQILTPEPFLLEFVPPMTNKAAGLRVLCKALRHDGDDDDDDDDDDHGVELSDVLAFGDGTNDVEMLASVGEGVCMANGGEAARAAATRISRWAHHEDAVAHELAAICGWPDDISSISRPTPPS
jgi:hydroxymethylpyrimidine pyrophosphatase-like HAD family hydrolase